MRKIYWQYIINLKIWIYDLMEEPYICLNVKHITIINYTLH